ncbi:methyltransferase domain-containing protein, partial [bacterium]|nr:methyltransferase domain-containing protein [bacterium]
MKSILPIGKCKSMLLSRIRERRSLCGKLRFLLSERKKTHKTMSGLAFKIMTIIMSIRKIFRNIKEETELAGINTGDYILDFGCGPGFNAIPATQKVGDEGKVFALDINPRAIEIVKKKKRKYNLTNIHTILSDCDTKLKSQSIDVVYLHNTFPMIKNKENVLDELYRVLKVNGKLSYMSRTLSRIAGHNPKIDDDLRKYLEHENKFKLIKEQNKHFVFEKI